MIPFFYKFCIITPSGILASHSGLGRRDVTCQDEQYSEEARRLKRCDWRFGISTRAFELPLVGQCIRRHKHSDLLQF